MTRFFLFVMTLVSTACMETGIRALHYESAGVDDPTLDTPDSELDDPEYEHEGHNDVEDRPEDDLSPEDEEPAPEDDCDHTSDLISVIDRTEQCLRPRSEHHGVRGNRRRTGELWLARNG